MAKSSYKHARVLPRGISLQRYNHSPINPRKERIPDTTEYRERLARIRGHKSRKSYYGALASKTIQTKESEALIWYILQQATERELDIKHLARMASCPYSTFHNYSIGSSLPRPARLANILKNLGSEFSTIDELITAKKTNQNQNQRQLVSQEGELEEMLV